MECQFSESCQLQKSPSIWQDNSPNSQVASPNQHARTTQQEKHRISLDMARWVCTRVHFGGHRSTLSFPGTADRSLPTVLFCEPSLCFHVSILLHCFLKHCSLDAFCLSSFVGTSQLLSRFVLSSGAIKRHLQLVSSLHA